MMRWRMILFVSGGLLFSSITFGINASAASVETVGDLKVSGTIDNSGGSGIKFPDGTVQSSACTGCSGDVVPISLGGTGASTISEARTNLGVPGLTTTNTFILDQLMLGNLFIYGNLSLPSTSASAGIIKMGTDNLIHSYGTNSFFAGRGAGNTTTLTGGWNTGIGHSVLGVNTEGAFNTGVGSLALMNNTEGVGNCAMGYSALYNNTTGSSNTALGNSALNANVSGYFNTAVGSSALSHNTGISNTAVGQSSLTTNTSGNYNTATGVSALGNNETGGLNAAYGQGALYGNTGGSYNTGIGYSAGYTGSSGSNANTTGSYNTFIGANSGPGTSTQLSNATAIGANALVSQSDSLVLGAPGVKVGIGTSAPTQTLDVAGNVIINDKEIYLRSDINHGLGWYGLGKQFASTEPDGPVLYGWSGGALGITAGGQKVLMDWDDDSFDFYGFVRVNVLSGGSTSACLDGNNTISTCSSDSRLKKDVVTISDEMDVLDSLSKLRGVTFNWDRSNERAAGMGSGRDMGMIAQEVEGVFPEIVHTDSDGYKSMDYPKLVAFLIEVNKAQQDQIKELYGDVEALRKRLSALEGNR